MQHDIQVCTTMQIKQWGYRVNQQKRQVITEEVEYLLEHGMAVPSLSSWSLPCIVVPKPAGTIRFVRTIDA